MVAVGGDWIIKDEHGEFNVCKPGTFEAAYDRVADCNETRSNMMASSKRYEPAYDTTIDTVTTVVKFNSMHAEREYPFDAEIRATTKDANQNTLHVNYIDWKYPFDDPEHRQYWSCSDDEAMKKIERLKSWLKLCEDKKGSEAYASDYSGRPRIWYRVIRVGMASTNPYWTPRPTVIMANGTRAVWCDWTHLTDAKCRE